MSGNGVHLWMTSRPSCHPDDPGQNHQEAHHSQQRPRAHRIGGALRFRGQARPPEPWDGIAAGAHACWWTSRRISCLWFVSCWLFNFTGEWVDFLKTARTWPDLGIPHLVKAGWVTMRQLKADQPLAVSFWTEPAAIADRWADLEITVGWWADPDVAAFDWWAGPAVPLCRWAGQAVTVDRRANPAVVISCWTNLRLLGVSTVVSVWTLFTILVAKHINSYLVNNSGSRKQTRPSG